MQDIPTGISGRTAIDVAREVALEGGRILVERFHETMEASFKGRGNIVTDVDAEVEAKVHGMLRDEYPDALFVGEESATVRADHGLVWIVDPLDGTRNYASRIPFFSIVVGVALDGEPLVGITLPRAFRSHAAGLFNQQQARDLVPRLEPVVEAQVGAARGGWARPR